MDFKIPVIAFGILTVLLVSGPSLAFGTHDDHVWDDQYVLQPFDDGKAKIKKLTFPSHIAKNSPDCIGSSPECEKEALYQITGYEYWQPMGQQLNYRCVPNFEQSVRETQTVASGTSDSFSTTASRTLNFGSTSTASTEVGSTTKMGIGFAGFGISANLDHEMSSSSSSSYEQSRSEGTSSAASSQTQATYELAKESETITTVGQDLSGRAFKQLDVQVMNKLKYDLWIPITKSPNDGIDTDPKVFTNNVKDFKNLQYFKVTV